MTDIMKALYLFWSSFDLPAYVEDNVPDGAKLPYITYSVTDPDWDSQAAVTARVWYRDTSYVAISSKVDEIKQRIGGGISLNIDNGSAYLFKDSNFIQFQPYSQETEIKVAYLSMIIMHVQ